MINRPRRLIFYVILALGGCLALLPANHARAATATATPLSPGDAQQLLAVLNDPAKLAALKATLGDLQKAVAAPPAPLGLPRDSLGAQLVESLDTLAQGLAAEGRDVGQTLHAFGDARPWAVGMVRDPARRGQLAAELIRLALILGVAFGVSALLIKAVARPIAALARLAAGQPPEPSVESDNAAPGQAASESHERARRLVDFARMLHALRLLPLAFAHIVLELVPIAGFALAAFLFEISGLVQSRQDLVVVQSAIGAFVIGGAVVAVLHGLLAPERPALRLILMRDVIASRICFWLWLMVLVAASGFAALNVLEKLGLPGYAGSVAEKLLVLIEHVLLAVLIFRCRAAIAAALQPRRGQGASAVLLRGVIRNIWIVLIFFDFALWLIWAAALKNGYVRLVTATAETALVLLLARLMLVALLGAIEHLFKASGQGVLAGRAGRYTPVARRLAAGIVLIAAIIAVLQAWGMDAFAWFRADAVGGRLVSALAVALVAVIAGIITWEAANIGLERHIDRLQHDAGSAARVARAQTLMPILRIVLFTFIAVVLVMTILSEIGVNIAPLLGGAGIIGVAIGFGSQKLVQDFITGIFLLLENAMQVGDFVTCAGLSGSVEHLSIRTLHLRAGDGSLQIIPFSSVTTLTNSNRGLGNAPVAVDIAPDEDPDQVADILKSIVAGMRADPAFGHGMLSELQYWGVDRVTTQAVTLVGQIVCTDAARYGVQREFNRRMKMVFEERGIRLAQPVQTVRLAQSIEPSDDAGPPGQNRPSAVVKESPPTSALGHRA